MRLIGRLLINVIALLVVAYLLPGFVLADLTSTFVAAIVIGAVNTFIRPIIQLIALPITIATLGIAAFLINALLLWAVAYFVPGFTIDSFVTTIIASLLLSLISSFLHKLAK